MSGLKSGVTNFEEIRKRMDELGIEPFVVDKTPKGSENGVDTTAPDLPKSFDGDWY